MNDNLHSIAWQRRPPGQSPALIRHGLEERFGGTVAELVARTKAITLVSRDGAEVQVVVRRTLGPDAWEGEVLRVAPTDSGLKVGTTVAFEGLHVHGGTV